MRLLEVTPTNVAQYYDGLTELLLACVEAGASIGFLWPLHAEQALGFWQNIGHSLHCDERRLLIMVDDESNKLAATVQLCLDMPANGQHRAEIAKLMVHPDFRRRGLARQLMMQAMLLAKSAHRSLLVLDTRTGDHAEQLYRELGFQLAGVIPAYARSVEGSLTSTSLMYKLLD